MDLSINIDDTKELINDVEEIVEDVEEIKDNVENVIEKIEDLKEDVVEVIDNVAEHLGLSEKDDEVLKQYYQNLENKKECVWGKGCYNCINYNMDDKTLDVAIDEVSITVLESVKQLGKDYTNAANLAKNIVFDLNNQRELGKNIKELYDKTELDKFGKSKYIIMKMKIKEPSNKFVFICKNKHKILQIKYCILVPLNQKARIECNKAIKPQVKNIIKKLKKNVK